MEKELKIKAILDDYRAEVQRACPKLRPDELDYFIEKLTVSELEPKEFYLEATQEQKQIGYVAQGLLRLYFLSPEGDDITINFLTSGMLAADYSSFENPQPSRYNVQCIEKSFVINHSYFHLQDCAERFPAFEHYMRIVIEQIFKRTYHRMQSFLFNTAEERYLNFIKENPSLLNRVSVTHLCSYLGIGRQALTRIRKRIILK